MTTLVDKTDLLNRKNIEKIRKSGKEKGLSDRELEQRKNQHRNTIYKSFTRISIAFLIFIAVFIGSLLVLYAVNLYRNPEYLQRVVEEAIKTLIISAATLGIDRTVNSLFRREM